MSCKTLTFWHVWAWPGTPGRTQSKVIVWVATFPWWTFPCKYLRYRLVSSRDIDYQIIFQSDWTISFWPITFVPEFSNMGFAQGNRESWMFHFRSLPVKINYENEKTLFVAHFRKIRILLNNQAVIFEPL